MITIGFYREVWLVVAQGGWWGVREILERLPSGVEVDDPQSRLWIMARRHGYLERRGRGARAEYAVTDRCRTPHGIPVSRLCQALIPQRNDPAQASASAASLATPQRGNQNGPRATDGRKA